MRWVSRRTRRRLCRGVVRFDCSTPPPPSWSAKAGHPRLLLHPQGKDVDGRPPAFARGRPSPTMTLKWEPRGRGSFVVAPRNQVPLRGTLRLSAVLRVRYRTTPHARTHPPWPPRFGISAAPRGANRMAATRAGTTMTSLPASPSHQTIHRLVTRLVRLDRAAHGHSLLTRGATRRNPPTPTTRKPAMVPRRPAAAAPIRSASIICRARRNTGCRAALAGRSVALLAMVRHGRQPPADTPAAAACVSMFVLRSGHSGLFKRQCRPRLVSKQPRLFEYMAQHFDVPRIVNRQQWWTHMSAVLAQHVHACLDLCLR
jgi:hypothetical protein